MTSAVNSHQPPGGWISDRNLLPGVIGSEHICLEIPILLQFDSVYLCFFWKSPQWSWLILLASYGHVHRQLSNICRRLSAVQRNWARFSRSPSSIYFHIFYRLTGRPWRRGLCLFKQLERCPQKCKWIGSTPSRPWNWGLVFRTQMSESGSLQNNLTFDGSWLLHLSSRLLSGGFRMHTGSF
jgi:hypothetical protein